MARNIKGNQATLLDDLALMFEDRKQPDFTMHDPPDHGRIETRNIWTTTALNDAAFRLSRLFLAQAALPHLKSARGVIINIVDIHAVRPLKDHTIYGAAKAGLAFLTRALARDLAPDVRVNGVAPGAILWPEGGVSDQMREIVLKQIPLKRVGEPADIANCVLYLVRDAPYVTGQVIAVDGGSSVDLLKLGHRRSAAAPSGA